MPNLSAKDFKDYPKRTNQDTLVNEIFILRTWVSLEMILDIELIYGMKGMIEELREAYVLYGVLSPEVIDEIELICSNIL